MKGKFDLQHGPLSIWHTARLFGVVKCKISL